MQKWTLYRVLFKNLKILPLGSQYTLSLPLFVVNIKNKSKLNCDVLHVTLDKNVTFTSRHQIYQYIKRTMFKWDKAI